MTASSASVGAGVVWKARIGLGKDIGCPPIWPVPEVDAHPASAEAAVIAESDRKLRRDIVFSKLITRVCFPLARKRRTSFPGGLFNACHNSRKLSRYAK
jgi:hypothetical protein